MTNGNQVQIWTCSSKMNNNNQVWDVGYMYESPDYFFCSLHLTFNLSFHRYNQLPTKSESGQSGTNNCGTTSSQSSTCQNVWINDADDFCLWAPPQVGNIGDTEQNEVACAPRAAEVRVLSRTAPSKASTLFVPRTTSRSLASVISPKLMSRRVIPVVVSVLGHDRRSYSYLTDASFVELDPHGSGGLPIFIFTPDCVIMWLI
jgi:hypothetical protein